jgi:hypothetical protein
MDHDDRIKQLRRQDMDRRRKLPGGDQDTMLPCPPCDGTGLRTLTGGQNYRAFGCPWCDGSGVVTSNLIALYRRFQKEGGSALK